MVVENREKAIRINLTSLGQAAGLVVCRAFQLGQSGLSVGGEPGGGVHSRELVTSFTCEGRVCGKFGLCEHFLNSG